MVGLYRMLKRLECDRMVHEECQVVTKWGKKKRTVGTGSVEVKVYNHVTLRWPLLLESH